MNSFSKFWTCLVKLYESAEVYLTVPLQSRGWISLADIVFLFEDVVKNHRFFKMRARYGCLFQFLLLQRCESLDILVELQWV